MRIDRDRLIHLSLVALAEQVELAHDGPPPPSYGVRLALAVLFSFSKGDRRPFDEFWRVMRDRQESAASENISSYCRTAFLQTQLRGVMRSVGVEPSVATELPLGQAARKAYPPRSAQQRTEGGE